MATNALTKLKLNVSMDIAPVITANGAILVQNHKVNRSRTFPFRSEGST